VIAPHGGASKAGKWLLVAVALMLAGAAMLWVRRSGSEQEVRQPEIAADSLLNIPLERTVSARQEFLAAYRIADGRHARALYEEYLPRIGANGLREEIRIAHPSCHDEGHDLGKVIFARLRDVGASLESCSDACASGCMHGVLMQFFTDSGSPGASVRAHHHSSQLTTADVAGRIPTICETQALARMYRPGDCAHGVGHAVMFLSNYDIPKGIDLCERFPSYALRYYCATGAYMEYRITKTPTDYSSHGPLYPCDTALYPAACFRYVMTNSIREQYARGATLETLQRQCAGLRGKYRLGCFHGIGNAHVGIIGLGQKTLALVCGFGTREDQTVCVDGAIERLGKFTPAIAGERCASLTDWRRDVCQASASRKMYDMERSFALYQR
jgi:hypothetical protein